jgi:hypothetical protein
VVEFVWTDHITNAKIDIELIRCIQRIPLLEIVMLPQFEAKVKGISMEQVPAL